VSTQADGIAFGLCSSIQQGVEAVKAGARGAENGERSGDRPSGQGREEVSQGRQLAQRGDPAPPGQEEPTGDFTHLVAVLAASEVSIARQNRYRDLPSDARPKAAPVVVDARKSRVQAVRVRVSVAHENFPEIPRLAVERGRGADPLVRLVQAGTGGALSGRHSSPGTGRGPRARSRRARRLGLICAFVVLSTALGLLVNRAVTARLARGSVVSLESR
jgi:hypothetical protein